MSLGLFLPYRQLETGTAQKTFVSELTQAELKPEIFRNYNFSTSYGNDPPCQFPIFPQGDI